MAAYVEGVERTGEMPGYDREALERALDEGRLPDAARLVVVRIEPIAVWPAPERAGKTRTTEGDR